MGVSCICISRDFQYKVKGISMSVFTDEDVQSLASEGNASFNEKYMANHGTHDPAPSSTDINKQKEFIRMKYLDKKWHIDGPGNTNGGRNANRRSVRIDTVVLYFLFGFAHRFSHAGIRNRFRAGTSCEGLRRWDAD